MSGLQALKSFVNRNFPWLRDTLRPPKWQFTKIYRTHHWHDPESASGEGSNLEQTRVIRRELPNLIADLKVRSMLDIPCGDYYWMQRLDLPCSYIGGDIVEELVRKNAESFPGKTFRILDLISDELPTVDLILCRDCLVHLSFRNSLRALRNIKKSGTTYLLTTTYPAKTENADILTGSWRPLNLEIAPFHFPKPMRFINEECPQDGGLQADKSLALWQISDLP
jgi:SAM-dependent methyltransferase